MKENPLKFVSTENALQLNERLIIQQGVFLCPGDISVRFEYNLKEMKEWKSSNSIVKLSLRMKEKDRFIAIKQLRHANVERAGLFPGMDGFAQSLRPRLPFYRKMAIRGVGQNNYE